MTLCTTSRSSKGYTINAVWTPGDFPLAITLEYVLCAHTQVPTRPICVCVVYIYNMHNTTTIRCASCQIAQTTKIEINNLHVYGHTMDLGIVIFMKKKNTSFIYYIVYYIHLFFFFK